MKRTQRSVFLAGLLVLSLSACSSWGGWKNPFSSGGTSSAPTSTSTSTSTEAPPSTGSNTEKPATNGNGASTNGQQQ